MFYYLRRNKLRGARTDAAKIIVSFAYFVLSPFFFSVQMHSAENGVYGHLRLFKMPTLTKRKFESSLPRRQQMAYSVSFVYKRPYCLVS